MKADRLANGPLETGAVVAKVGPVVVGIVQITDQMEHRTYLPYAAGVLQVYVLAKAPEPQRYSFLPTIWLRLPIEQLATRFDSADVVGLSLYMWNCEYTLALARAIRARNPRAILVCGGPHVPDRSEAFLRKHAYLDAVCHGHGEKTFLELLEALPGRDWHGIQGLGWIDAAGVYHNQGRGERVRELDAGTSPYLAGFFEPILAEHSHLDWVGVWETNRGCPFSCTFCDWGSAISSKVMRFEMERLLAEIEWFGQQRIDLLYVMDANFGILPRDLDIAAAIVAGKARHGYPAKAIIQMTKNQAERTFQTFKILNQAELIFTATLSLQSVTPAVLKAIKRENISLETYHELLRRFVSAGIPTYTDILIGLPGETFESFLDGIDALITQGQHQEIRFWNTYILPNAELAQPESRARYRIESVTVPYLTLFTPARERTGGIQEQMEMLVATDTMSRQDWMRMRSLAWLTQLIYYEHFLQLPLLLIQALTGLKHRDLLMAFFAAPLPPGAVMLREIRGFFNQRAQAMLAGQPEYLAGKDPTCSVPIWVQTQYFAINELLFHPRLDQLFAEVHGLLQGLLSSRGAELPPGLLIESLVVAQALFLSRLPAWQGFNIQVHYNLWEMYQQVRKGERATLKAGNWRIVHRPSEAGQMTVMQLAESEGLAV